MMLALMLAQLVLPWPRLDSPLVQPGPTICVGECAGPVVYGAAERGRLVVACDMTSDTCSDGRKITTTRSTPVPCEVSPGVWEMVPEDTGCYSVRGLESWAQNTSYLSYGAELDRSPWEPIQGGAVEVLPDGYRIHPAAGAANSGLTQAGIVAVPAGGESRTLSCLVRTQEPTYIRFWLSGNQSASFPAVSTGGRWEVVSATREVAEGSSTTIRVGNGPATESPIPFDVKACWLTRTDTPGRPCWGGEAPVTCAADRHTISTEGWPTEAGEVEIVFHYYGQAAARPERLIDGRSIGDLEHYTLFISSTTGFPLTLSLNATPIVQSSSLSWESGKVYRVRLRRTLDGEIELFRDGVRVAADSGPPLSWSPLAALGARYDFIEGQRLNGSISSLRVRSAE